MTYIATVRSPSKATLIVWFLLGTFFAFLTARVLLWEVHGRSDLTAEHWLTAGALVGAIASGIWFWRMLWAAKFLTAAGLALAFSGATVYCLVGSAGRADDMAYQRNADAKKVNDGRATALKDLADAKAAYEATMSGDNRNVREAKIAYEAALKAEQTECESGAGPKCIAKRETTANRRTDLETAEAQLRALAKERRANLDGAEARVRELPAEQRENSRLKRAAEIIAFYRGVDERNAEKGLALIWPFIPPSVCELLTIVFLHLAFGHARQAREDASTLARLWERLRSYLPQRQLMLPAPTVAASPVVSTPPVSQPQVSVPTVSGKSVKPEKVKRQRPTDVQMVFQALESLGGQADSQDQLAEVMQISKGEASKRVDACGKYLFVERVGRCHVIRPNYNL